MPTQKKPPQARWIVFRANPYYRTNLPLSIRSVGCYDTNSQWVEQRPQQRFTQLFWTFGGSGSFGLAGKRTHVGTGEIYIYRPGDAHDLRTEGSRWSYCWITLDHPHSVDWVDGFALPRHFTPGTPCPRHLFQRIREALELGTEQGEQEAAHCAHVLLLAATPRRESPADTSLAAEAKAMIDASCADPTLNVQSVADALGIHRSTLFRHFTALYGLTPVRYLGNLRLRHALALINEGHHSIGEIARLTGFSDPDYLSRRISSRAGMPARKIRQGRA